MFKISSKSSKEFFQKLKPGTLLCDVHSGFLENCYLDIFEFGHFDEKTNTVYWQTAIYHVGRFVSKIEDLAAIRQDGKLYEQKPFGDISKCKNIRLANENERNKYYDELDCKFARKYCKKTLTRGDLILLPSLNNKLSRIHLSVAPPEYLYVESGGSKMIFKTVPLRMETPYECVIKYKGSIMINDDVRVSDSEEEINACDYKLATVIREATELERAIFMSRICMQNVSVASSNIKNIKISFKNLLDLKLGTILYGEDSFYEYIFPYGGHTRIEGITRVKYKECLAKLELKKNGFREVYLRKNGIVSSYEHFQTLREADDTEIREYQRLKYDQEERDGIHEKYCRHLNFCKEKMKPFVTKVLVSNGLDDIWRPAVFGCVSEEESKPVCVVGGSSFKYCIAYAQHKNLCGRSFNFSDILI